MSTRLSIFASLLVLSAVAHVCAQQKESTNRSGLQSRPLYQATQQVLDTLTRAEIAREEASFAGQRNQNLDSARKQLRAAISQLQSLETQLTQRLRETYQKKPSTLGKNDWTTRELESLFRNLKVQQARAYRNQALCYSQNSVDRVNALSLALEPLSDVVTLPLDEASVWQARVEQVVCLRLMKKTAAAQQQIERWRKASPPANIASRLTGESLQIDLDESALDRALAKINALPAHATVAPETDDAILEILLAARRQSLPPRAAQFTQRAVSQLQHIAQAHGPYWKQRAEARLGQALAAQTDTDDPELLSYAAASFYAAGKTREAVATYDRIATLLTNEDSADRRFQVRKTAAAIVREMNQREEALARFRQLALDQVQHAEAAGLHLIAIGLAAELTRDGVATLRGERFESYLALLVEHLKMWPEQPSAVTVEQWLSRAQLPEIDRQRAQTLAALGKRQPALKLYRKLLQAAPDDAELVEAYATLLATGTEKSEWQEALQVWQRIEKRSKPGGPRWTRGRRARLALLGKLGEGEQAKRLRQLTEILYPQGVNDE